jgi:hypothetical protein
LSAPRGARYACCIAKKNSEMGGFDMHRPTLAFACAALAATAALPAEAQEGPRFDEASSARAFARVTFGPVAADAKRATFGLGLYGAGEACAGGIARLQRSDCEATALRGVELRSGATGFDLWLAGARETNLSERARFSLGAAESRGGVSPWIWIGLGVAATAGVVAWALEEEEAENCGPNQAGDFFGQCHDIVV